jgi:hypothetical protein
VNCALKAVRRFQYLLEVVLQCFQQNADIMVSSKIKIIGFLLLHHRQTLLPSYLVNTVGVMDRVFKVEVKVS